MDIKEALKNIENSQGKYTDPTMSWSKLVKINSAKKICQLYALGEYTIQSCCDACGVNYETFKDWAQVNVTQAQIESKEYRRGFIPEVHELYKEAVADQEVNYFALLKNRVREGLLLRASGMEYEEKSSTVKVDEHGNTKPMEVKSTKKFIVPDSGVLIFLSKNVDKENFSDTVKQEHSGRVQTGTGLEGLTNEELKLKRAELEAKLNSTDGL